MSERVLLVYSPEVLDYELAPDHPLKPVRVVLTRELIAASGLLDLGNVEERPWRAATHDELALVHTDEYIDVVRRAGSGEPGPWARYGLGPGDNPIFRGMHEASSAIAGGTLEAAEAVLAGRADHAFHPAGGLHHAMPDRASGFCVYDDPAVAIAWMLERGLERIAYVDVDVHHGDGVQEIFYGEPRVLTVSLHESGRYLFPGTGFADERGRGAAEGTAVNVPLPPSTDDVAWLRAFGEVALPAVRAFSPQVLVTQLGCDTHHTDPIAHLGLSTAAYRECARLLHELAHETTEGRWVATGGGGYQWARVVPRAWTIYFAEMTGAELPDELPRSWIDLAARTSGGPVPETMSEVAPRSGAVRPEVERAIAEARAGRPAG